MIEAWPAATVRAAEQPLLAAGAPLMERASFALAAQVARDLRARRRSVRGASVALLVGAGNNGGDALHAGAFLAQRGCAVTALLVDERAHARGLAALHAAGGRDVRLYERPGHEAVEAVAARIAGADVVVDGLVGIGAEGSLRGLAADLVQAVLRHLPARSDRARPWVVAVDVPSGIGVDDGAVPGPVLRADRTVTFGAAKPGLLLPPAAQLTGEVTVVDIGIEPAGPPAVRRLADADVAWPVPGQRDHKYTRGVVGVVAGTSRYPGAGVLTTSAAALAGAGMVRYHGPDAVGHLVLAARPEVVTAGGRVQAWALGSGVPAAPDAEHGADDGQRDRIRETLAAVSGRLGAKASGGPVPAVVDAGALDVADHELPAWVVLTPHAGELAVLLGSRGEHVDRAAIEAEPLRWARRAHELTGATVLLKGGVTVVVGPGGAYAQADAPGWLATAGSGDVLAGLLATMLAARSAEVVAHPDRAAEVAAAAALVHGRAAEHANPGGPVAALDVAAAIPATVAALVRARGGAPRTAEPRS